MNTEFLLMAKYEKPRLDLRELADFLGVKFVTAQNMRADGSMPIPTYKEGSRVFADIRDVAAYLDTMRQQAHMAHEAIKSQLSLNRSAT